MDNTTPLVAKSPTASVREKILPFGSDLQLREQYINYFGDIRFGKLLEELDTIAAFVAYGHTNAKENQLAVVTAACDRIDLLDRLPIDADLRLKGSINWVGRSSMEVGVRIESKHGDSYQLVARAYFIMVARTGSDHAAPINPLDLKTDEEKRRSIEGQKRQEQRKTLASQNYLKSPPAQEESRVLHDIFMQLKQMKANGVFMEKTMRQATLLMQPQSKNVYNKIFGGYLMLESLELAWNTAYLYSQCYPLFLGVDHMSFYKPVEIGSIVSFNGVVIYTNSSHMMVEVTAEVIHPKTGNKEITNVCYFTFKALDDDRNSQEVKRVLPYTYEEGLKYLDGAKRYKLGQEIREKNIS
jgi:acyl-coenzyme A thioesterase 9